MRGITLIGAAALVFAAADWKEEGRRWWAHVEYLASDRLEGRDTASPGHRLAAQYVAQQLEAVGMRPAGAAGYFQPVPLKVRQLDEAQTSLEFVRHGKAEPVKLGDDAILSARGDPAGRFEGEAVFTGYGLKIPELDYDDLAGLDLRGKVAVFLSGGPKSAPGPLKAHYQSAAERWKAMQAAGAIGLVSIPNPKSMDIPWARSALTRNRPSMALDDPALEDSRGLDFSATLNPARAERFFAGSGHTLAEILAAADAGTPLPRFPLGGAFRARVAVKRWQAESQNVAAALPGAALKDEYVVVSAHLDHLGVGAAIHGDRVYNGAMDDASGVASLLEVARLLRGAQLKRSVLFLAVTAEEKGLLGSKYFAAHPTVAGRVVADINMDMFLPLTPLQAIEVQGLNESTLGGDLRAAAREAGIEVQADKEPDRNRFIRSDQYSFIRRGVPALAFKFGYQPGSPEEQIYRAWYRDRYHAPSDDLRQPVDREAAAQFNYVIRSLVERVANAAEPPRWNPDSFFRRFAAQSREPAPWTTWAAREEIAPRTFRDGGALAISGNSNAAAYGGWERSEPVRAGAWYRFTARYRAAGVPDEGWQVVARLDWKTAEGKRAGQPEYAWKTSVEGEWRNLTLEAPAPENAAAVAEQLYLGNAPQGTVWWRDIALEEIPAPAPRPVTVAALNFRPAKTTGSSAESVRQMLEAASRAIPKADVILLGEGITVVSSGKKYAEVAEPVPGPTTERLGELARAKHAWVVAGLYEREGPAIYNTAVLVDRRGRFAGKYRKVYLPREEIEGGLTPGTAYPVFDTDFGKVGLMICWDLEYADPARALALGGAELILLPIWGGNVTLGKARAIENHVFLAAAGYDHPTYVLDPNGEMLAGASERGGAAIATIDLGRRYADPWLGDMRGRFFKELRLDVPVR